MKRLGLIVLVFLCLAEVQAQEATERRVVIERDGWELVGTLRLPPGTEPVPLVILCHTLWRGNRTVYASLAAKLSEQGLASLRLDLHAHGESTNLGQVAYRELDPAVVFGAWKDVVAAHRTAKQWPEVDSTRIGLLGASYSGEAVARAGRAYAFGQAYVILASGMISPESIVWMELSGVPWWHLVAEDDPTWALAADSLMRRRGYAAHTRFPSGGHATALLTTQPTLEAEIAAWFRRHLTAPGE